MNFTDYKLYDRLNLEVIATRENLAAVFKDDQLRYGRSDDIYSQAHNTIVQRAYSAYLQSKGKSDNDLVKAGQRYEKALRELHKTQDMVEAINININHLGDAVEAIQVDTSKGALHTYVEVDPKWLRSSTHKGIVEQVRNATNDYLEVV